MKWRDFNENYKVSENGDVMSKFRRGATGGIMIGVKTKKGYHSVGLRIGDKQKGFQVHRLVYELFVGKIPENYDIHHIDENKLNNHYSNLELKEHGLHTKEHKLGSKWLNYEHKVKIKKDKIIRDKTKNKTYDMKAYQRAYQKNYREMRLKSNR